MSKIYPRTQEEWEEFRFPPRPTLPVKSDESDSEDEDGDGDGGSDGGWGDAAYEPSLPRVTTWMYIPEQRRFAHLNRNKQVLIDKLDESSKIVRLIAVFQAQNLDAEDFVDALERASGFHHGCSLDILLRAHADGRPLVWPALDNDFSAEEEYHQEDVDTHFRRALSGH